MRKNKPQNLNEQLSRMKRLMSFDIGEHSHDKLTEQEYKKIVTEQGDVTGLRQSDYTAPQTPYWGKKKKGDINFNVPSGRYASFENSGLFEDIERNRILVISSTSDAIKLVSGGGITPDEGGDDMQPANIKIEIALEDPFNFDKTTLTPQGESNYENFLGEYNNIKENNIDQWDEYLNFVKSKGGLQVLGYASQDADPKANDGGRLSACSKYGVGKGPRNQYNLCLSQQRANVIRERLMKDLPELAEMITAKGLGETCDFGPCWSNNKNVTPQETAPNRRFIVKFPEFSKSTTPEKPTNTETQKGYRLTSDIKVDWSTVTTYIDLSEYGIEGKYKAIKDRGGVMLEPGKINEIRNLLGNKIPVIGPGRFNNSPNGKASLNENGIKIAAGDGETMFNEWKNPYDVERSTPADKTFYKQTDWVLAINMSPLRLKKYAMTLSKYST